MKALFSKFVNSDMDMAALRFSVIAVVMLFGVYKWFDFEVEALKSLIGSTWLVFLYRLFSPHGASYLLGIAEAVSYIGLIAGYWHPRWGVAGSLITICIGVVTLSLLPQLGKIDSFIVKDLLLIGAGMVLLKYDMKRIEAMG